MSVLINSTKNLILLPRYAKRIIAIILDIGLCILCTWIAFYLRLEKFIEINNITFFAALISIAFAIPIFWLAGLYRAMLRSVGSSISLTVLIAIVLYTLCYFSVISIYGINGIPRSIGIIQPLLLFISILSSRIIGKFLITNSIIFKNKNYKKNVLIYGAGNAGRQLLIGLENNPKMKVIGFLDDNYQLHNQTILGRTVFDPKKINELINLKDINLILLALPSINRIKKNQIIDYLNNYNVVIKTLPSIEDIVDGKVLVTDIKDPSIEDLLGREQVKPIHDLLSKNIYSKVVLVTGAGGSIGSEICRQIIKLNPKKLLILDFNEFALYRINEELKIKASNLKVIPLLIDIKNSSRLRIIFETFNIDTVYHAAAYKHVSLVEENVCEAVKNNIFGTFEIVQAVINNKVSNLVFISSDKAVRPTNIMGATKRLAEICIQSYYYYCKEINTKFAIVRFGNVLESSGSVIPKFKEQIRLGGPVTLTHPEVTRYFMTTIEASELVIQAGAMSKNCEVFVLDMGQSVKIRDLISKMIKLAGFTIKNSTNLDGEIEIKIIGLKPGEKLYEELLIGDNPQKTQHAKIKKAQDPHISFDKLKTELENLSTLIDNNMVDEVKNTLTKLLPSYKSNSDIIDHLYTEQKKLSKKTKKF
jgi:FlaA1/EpsC-like NDP-sugar epimerase